MGEQHVRVLLINSDFIEASGLIRWLTPIASVTLAETAEEVIERLDRGEWVDRVVVCAGAKASFANRFHRSLMRRYQHLAPRILYLSSEPLAATITSDGARAMVAPTVTARMLSRCLSTQPLPVTTDSCRL